MTTSPGGADHPLAARQKRRRLLVGPAPIGAVDISNLIVGADDGGRSVVQSSRVVSILVLAGALALFFLALVVLSYV